MFHPMGTELARRYYIAALGEPVPEVRETEIASVDLTLPVEAIRASLRKSYRSLVNWGLKNMSIERLDAKCADRAAFDEIKAFHRKVAGKCTRPDETWEIQWRMVEAGEAFCVLGRDGERLIGANMILVSDVAYYGVGVYDKDLMDDGYPIAHGLLFYAILHCKRLGLSRFVLGDVGGGDEKQDGIAHFKKGFATEVVLGPWTEIRRG